MRKITFLVLGLSITLTGFSQSKPQTITSTIEKVTVYTQGAQVVRKANAGVSSGKSTLLFSGISPDINPQSIQVKGTGKFTILSVNHQLNFINEQARREEITKLETQQEQWNAKLEVEKQLALIYKNEESILQKNQSIGGSASGVKTVDLKEAVDFHRNRLTEIYLKLSESDKNRKRIDSALNKIRQQLTALNQPKDYRTSEILVSISATGSQQANFEISYFVKNAGWYPTYDLYVTDINSPLSLNLKANLYQTSGEDWKEVKLTVSNGNPTENSIATKLEPWFLYYGTPYRAPNAALLQSLQGRVSGLQIGGNQIQGRVVDGKTGEAIPFATVRIKGTNMGTQTDVSGNFTLQRSNAGSVLEVSYVGYNVTQQPISGQYQIITLNQSANSLQEVVVTGYGSRDRDDDDGNLRIRGAASLSKSKSIPLETHQTYQPTSLSFEIATPYTLLNDGKVYTAQLREQEVPAIYDYYTAPKIEKAAYLTARIADWQQLDLLEGEISLFFEGAYLGKSIIDPANASDTLSISLGKDKNIVVERKQIKEYRKKQFFGNNKTDSRAYEITIRNNKQLPINIVVQDQFPVSTNKEINVQEEEVKDASVDKETRIVTWQLKLKEKEEKKQEIRFSVKYPSEQIILLD